MKNKGKVGYAFVVCDLLHVGHLRFFKKCKEYCDFLIVGIYSDELTRKYKRKPVIPFEQRMELIANLKDVDMVVKVENKDATPMLKKLTEEGWKINYLFHGDDWKNVKGKEFIENIGGQLILTPYEKGISSSHIIERIKKRYFPRKVNCKRRSMLKSLIWRLMGIGILALITYAFTRHWILTTLVTLSHHFSFIWIYYLHERLWQRISLIGIKRKILRALIYETILGHLVLGFFTFLFTGSWVKVSLITLTYIENKLWIYIFYDWIWDKLKWRTKNA